MKTHYLALPTGQYIPLEGDQLMIGRLPYDPERRLAVGDLNGTTAVCDGNWIYLPNLFVSRQHAVLTRIEGGNYAIEDAGSRGGTFVNDQALTEKRVLEFGDTIRIGQIKIEYCDEIRKEPPIPWENFGSD